MCEAPVSSFEAQGSEGPTLSLVLGGMPQSTSKTLMNQKGLGFGAGGQQDGREHLTQHAGQQHWLSPTLPRAS